MRVPVKIKSLHDFIRRDVVGLKNKRFSCVFETGEASKIMSFYREI